MNKFIILLLILFLFYIRSKIEQMDNIPCDNQCQKRRYEVCLIRKDI